MKPGSKPKAPRKKHEPVEDRLLATAGRCFIEDGFGFGIDDILAQSNVAKMSLYVKFQSKYGLIERLLEDAAVEWRNEIERVAVDDSLQGAAKVVELIKSICRLSRDLDRRTGLIAQALIEFPRTGKADETHKKKDLVHECALRLQRELIKELEDFCRATCVDDPAQGAQQLLLLVNGYLITEPLLGKASALTLLAETAQVLFRSVETSKAVFQESPKPRGRVVILPVAAQSDILSVKSRAKVRKVGKIS